MLKMQEVIVVEGRYDQNTIHQVVDATVVTLNGFAVFHDHEKLQLLRRLAQKRGLVILTDSDGAGFVLRNYLKGALPADQVKHAYIPDIYGKERRKRTPGKEGKLGVEGMRPEVLLSALRRAGVVFEQEDAARTQEDLMTKADLFAWGLSGTAESGVRRKALLRQLELPEYLSANALLQTLNLLYTRTEFLTWLGNGIL